jgi:adenylate cyclase class 2
MKLFRVVAMTLPLLGINMAVNAADQAGAKAEIEVKFFVDKAGFEQRLQAAGATLALPCRLMRRQLFALPLHLIKPNMHQVARVRDEGNKTTMTLKESALPRTMSSVQELELVVDSFDNAVAFLVMAGYVPATYQENKRTSWQFDGCCVEIDEWPGLPVYAEIEASSEADLKRVAAILGVQESEFMCSNVFDLYADKLGLDAKKLKVAPRLTFENIEQVRKECA